VKGIRALREKDAQPKGDETMNDLHRLAWAAGMLLLLATTALEVRAWWGTRERRARRRYALVSILNIAAAALLILSKLY